MPVFNDTWDETKPAGSRDLALGDDDIREFKRAIRQRLEEDHEFAEDESGNDNIGYHKKVTLTKRTAGNPTIVDDAGIVFTKDAGSDAIELYYIDDDGNVTQLSKQGKAMGLGTDAWRTGDKILSSNTEIPTGWSDISATYTDNFIRISSGTPLSTGGANTHDHGASTGSFTLTTNEMPSHRHRLAAANVTEEDSRGLAYAALPPYGIGGPETAGSVGFVDSNANTSQFVENTGGGAGHSHSIASANNIPVYVQMKMYSKV